LIDIEIKEPEYNLAVAWGEFTNAKAILHFPSTIQLASGKEESDLIDLFSFSDGVKVKSAVVNDKEIELKFKSEVTEDELTVSAEESWYLLKKYKFEGLME